MRVGLNTGQVIVGDDGVVFGRQLITAARIANLGNGGELLA